jgi:hypothetical protein
MHKLNCTYCTIRAKNFIFRYRYGFPTDTLISIGMGLCDEDTKYPSGYEQHLYPKNIKVLN